MRSTPPTGPPWALIDAGSTRTKYALASAGPDSVGVLFADDRDDRPGGVARLLRALGGCPARFAVAGSHPARRDGLAAALNAAWHTPVVIDHAAAVPIELAGPAPNEIGVDRLLDCLAANRLRRPGFPALVIDAGTALVFNAVSESGQLLGGAICPGRRAMLAALHGATATLPDLAPGDDSPPGWPATTTADCLRLGADAATLGVVSRILAEYQENKLDVFLTGGDGDWLRRHADWPGSARVAFRPNLTLEGLLLAAEAAGR